MTATKSKPTPGPWRVAHENKAQSPWVVCDHEGGSIADCEPPGPWMSHETADANARMIAAAPDLLEALKYLVGECDDGMDDDYNPHAAPISKAHAAIAKAEGSP